jgi:hypothetical protein
VVTPSEANVTAGSSYVFNAVGYDKFGNIVQINPQWSTSVGSMDGLTLTAAVKVCSGYVNATVGNITGSASVTVVPDNLTRIDLQPYKVQIEVGATQEFTARGYDKYDNLIEIEPVWSTNIGDIIGNVLHAPQVVGSGFVEVKAGDISDSSTVTVGPGPLHHISISPGSLEITAGRIQAFEAAGYDRYGNVVTISPFWYSSQGNMTDNIFMAPTKVCKCNVTTFYFGIYSTVNVTVLPDELNSIFVAPKYLDIMVSESREFSAVGYDKFYNIIEIDPVWSTNVGSMTNNVFTAQSTEGVGQVTATVVTKDNKTVTGISDVVIARSGFEGLPKIIGRIPDQVRDEDSPSWTLTLTQYESDDKDIGKDLKWYVTGENTSLYILSGEFSDDDSLTFTPVPNAYGSDEIIIFLMDSDDFVDYQTVWVNLTPVNDEPGIYGAPDLILHYNEPYIYDYSPYIYDIDNSLSELTLNTIETSDQKFTAVDGLKVTYNYPESMLGQDVYVTVAVSDGTSTGKDILKITISDDYVPNLSKQLPDITLFEGTVEKNVFDLDDYFSDPDGDCLYYSYGETYVTVTINNDRTVDISSLSEWSGVDTVTFRAEDPVGALAEDTIVVTVIPVNDPPKISGVPDLIVHYDYDYKFDLAAYIEDKDNITDELSIFSSDINHVRFNDLSPTEMIINYPQSMLGTTVPVSIFVSDGIESDMQIINITVSDDYPPEVHTPLPDIEFYEDAELADVFDIDDFFLDMDGDSLYYTYGHTNIHITINENNIVTFNSELDWYGSEMATFRAVDPIGALAEDTIIITVLPINDPPSISDIPVQKGSVGQMWVLDLSQYINDVDNDIKDLEISVDSKDVDVNGLKLVFYSERSDSKKVTVTVSDGDKSVSYDMQVMYIEGERSIPIAKLFNWIILIIILVVLITLLVVYKKYKGDFVIDEAYIIYRNGILLTHRTNKNSNLKDMDDDILSSMFTAIQDFIKDSFDQNSNRSRLTDKDAKFQKKDEWQLKQLKLEGHNIMIEHGEHAFLAVIYSGTGGWKLKRLVKNITIVIEDKYADALNDWKGNMKQFQGIDDCLETLM